MFSQPSNCSSVATKAFAVLNVLLLQIPKKRQIGSLTHFLPSYYIEKGVPANYGNFSNYGNFGNFRSCHHSPKQMAPMKIADMKVTAATPVKNVKRRNGFPATT